MFLSYVYNHTGANCFIYLCFGVDLDAAMQYILTATILESFESVRFQKGAYGIPVEFLMIWRWMIARMNKVCMAQVRPARWY